MDKETVAFWYHGSYGLWCEILQEVNGVVKFNVINGRWVGFFDTSNGVLTVKDTSEQFAAKMWRGVIPPEHSKHYGDALRWLNSNVKI